MADIRKIEDELWEAADELRANSKLTSQQYCMPVLGLIFLRYAWGRFKRANAQIDEERSRIEGRKPPKEPQDYTAKGAMFIPEEARYDYLLNLPAQADAGRAVNAAMDAIAKLNPSLAGVLPNTYTELGNDLLASVIRIFNNPALDEEGDDIIGRIYEYFLGKFAPAVASDDGVFFTPKSLVRMIMNVIEPARGTMLDPACGSGGMFVSASDYVRDHGGNPAASMMFYGQEKVDYNAKLCLMNMAVHGMQGIIKSGDAANTFYHDAHALDGKCDYVAATRLSTWTRSSGRPRSTRDVCPWERPRRTRSTRCPRAAPTICGSTTSTPTSTTTAVRDSSWQALPPTQTPSARSAGRWSRRAQWT